MLKLAKNIPIREQVLRQLRSLILRNVVSGGERLYEEKLASEIGTSRTPVREALHVLEREGLVESIPRVGYVVKKLDLEEFEEIVEIRKAIECLAAIWAADKLTNAVLQDLKNNIKKSKELVRQGDIKKFVDMDAVFHEIIAKASGKKRIYEMSQNLRGHMLFYRISSIYVKEVAQRAIANHEGIVRAIESKNEEQIRQAIYSHLSQVRKDVLTYSFEKKHLNQY